MRPRIVVTGLGAVTPLGVGTAVLRAGLKAGRSCILHRVRTPGEDGGRYPEGAVVSAPVGSYEATVPEAEPAAAAPETTKGLRRAAVHVGFGAAASHEALQQSDSMVPPERRGLVFSSSLASCRFSYRLWHGLLASGAAGASPSLFSEGVPNALSGHLARLFQILGPGHMLGGGSDVGLRALVLAQDTLQAGRADLMLVGAAEELSEIASRGYRKFGVVKSRRADQSPAGLVLGEGAAAIVLERERDVLAAGRTPLLAVAGIRSAQLADLRREASIDQLARLIEPAVRQALESTGDAPLWLALSRNGTLLDRFEARALARVARRVQGRFEPQSRSRVKELLGDGMSVSPFWQLVEAQEHVAAGGQALVLSLSYYGAVSLLHLAPAGSRESSA